METQQQMPFGWRCSIPASGYSTPVVVLGGGEEAAGSPAPAVDPAVWMGWLGRAAAVAVPLVSCQLVSVLLQEKLKYFPLCVSTKIHQEDDAEEGLGSLPRNISSLSSLLLFNTTENL